MRLVIWLILMLIISTFFSSCKQEVKRNLPLSTEIEFFEEDESNVRKIFFNMYLPNEMSRLFERVGASYDPRVMNPSENISRYTTDEKIAINLGIYGVDMNYARIFNQTMVVAKYISSIKIIATKLGIPDDYYEEMLKGFERNFNDKDSLTKIVSEIYIKTDDFLKSEKKDHYAALIVMGGWVEALYIATRIYESDRENIEIMERIAEQKYSLNYLISLLNNYQDNPAITEYILMLKTLKNKFDKIEIYYEQENFNIDTKKNVISAKGAKIDVTPKLTNEIAGIVSLIRAELVM